VAVASAGAYASLHLADNHASTPPLNIFTGRMPFLSPNQQRQSTEGAIKGIAGGENLHKNTLTHTCDIDISTIRSST